MMIKEGNKIIGMYKDGQKVLKIIIEGNIINFGGGDEKPQNIIYYTTTDGQPVTLNATPANLVDNKYEDGQGMLIYDGDATLVEYMFRSGIVRLTTLETIDMEHIESITEIPRNCFASDGSIYNNSIKSIKLPKNLTTILTYAFQHTKNLEGLILPDSLTTINNYAFNNSFSAQSKPSIDFRNTQVASISSYCFQQSNISSVYLRPDTRQINSYGFRNCPNLSYVNFNELTGTSFNQGNVLFSPNCFEGCTAIEEVDLRNISSGYYIFGTACFVNCTNLKRLIMPKYNKVLFNGSSNTKGKQAFQNCSSLELIDFSYVEGGVQGSNISNEPFSGTIPETGVIRCKASDEAVIRETMLTGTLANWTVEVV